MLNSGLSTTLFISYVFQWNIVYTALVGHSTTQRAIGIIGHNETII